MVGRTVVRSRVLRAPGRPCSAYCSSLSHAATSSTASREAACGLSLAITDKDDANVAPYLLDEWEKGRQARRDTISMIRLFPELCEVGVAPEDAANPMTCFDCAGGVCRKLNLALLIAVGALPIIHLAAKHRVVIGGKANACNHLLDVRPFIARKGVVHTSTTAIEQHRKTNRGYNPQRPSKAHIMHPLFKQQSHIT